MLLAAGGLFHYHCGWIAGFARWGSFMKKLGSWLGKPLVIGAVAALIAGAVGALIVLVIILIGAGNGLSAEVWRNLILGVSAVAGLCIATWRSISASKQVKLTEAGHNTDRYQKGAAMLGDARLSVRQAGVFGLTELAENNFEAYHATVMKLLCSFIKDRSLEDKRAHELERRGKDEENQPPQTIAHDCQTALNSLCDLNRIGMTQVNKPFSGKIDLEGAILNGAFLGLCDLRNANFTGAKLQKAFLHSAKLSGSNLMYANLKSAILADADLSDSDLRYANLSAATLNGAILSNANLNSVKLHQGNGVTVKQLEAAKYVESDFMEHLMKVGNEAAKKQK